MTVTLALCLAFIVPVVLSVLFIAFEWWCSRGVASEEERTRHRLRDHHGFDPDRGCSDERGQRR